MTLWWYWNSCVPLKALKAFSVFIRSFSCKCKMTYISPLIYILCQLPVMIWFLIWNKLCRISAPNTRFLHVGNIGQRRIHNSLPVLQTILPCSYLLACAVKNNSAHSSLRDLECSCILLKKKKSYIWLDWNTMKHNYILGRKGKGLFCWGGGCKTKELKFHFCWIQFFFFYRWVAGLKNYYLHWGTPIIPAQLKIITPCSGSFYFYLLLHKLP